MEKCESESGENPTVIVSGSFTIHFTADKRPCTPARGDVADPKWSTHCHQVEGHYEDMKPLCTCSSFFP